MAFQDLIKVQTQSPDNTIQIFIHNKLVEYISFLAHSSVHFLYQLKFFNLEHFNSLYTHAIIFWNIIKLPKRETYLFGQERRIFWVDNWNFWFADNFFIILSTKSIYSLTFCTEMGDLKFVSFWPSETAIFCSNLFPTEIVYSTQKIILSIDWSLRGTCNFSI
jgi:hypothetical protein